MDVVLEGPRPDVGVQLAGVQVAEILGMLGCVVAPYVQRLRVLGAEETHLDHEVGRVFGQGRLGRVDGCLDVFFGGLRSMPG